jgi:CBS domain containing-hemolysin-like protein
VRPLPQLPRSLPLADALTRMRRTNSHLALVTDDDGVVVAMVAMEDLVEDLVGSMRDAAQLDWPLGRPPNRPASTPYD